MEEAGGGHNCLCTKRSCPKDSSVTRWEQLALVGQYSMNVPSMFRVPVIYIHREAPSQMYPCYFPQISSVLPIGQP